MAKIHDIRIAEGLNKTIIEIEADEPLLYTSFRLSNPDRLVVEMAEVSLGQHNKEIKIKEGPIRAIHPSPSGELDVTRIEFELSGPVKTDIRPDGLSIVVEATRREKAKKMAQVARSEEPPKGSFTFFGDEQKKPPPEEIVEKPIRRAPQSPSSGKGRPLAKIPVIKPPTPPLLVPPGAMAVPPLKTPKPTTRKKVPQRKQKTEIAQGKTTENAIKEKVEKEPPVVLAKKPVARKKAPPLPPAQNVLSVRFEQGDLLQLVVKSDGKLSPRIF
ncbi:MAG: AMIN domain-containing protein, partial [Nitrospinota bacterium]